MITVPQLHIGKELKLLNDKNNFEKMKVEKIINKYEGEDDDLYLVQLNRCDFLEWVKYSCDLQYFEIVPDRIAHKFLEEVKYKILYNGELPDIN